MLQLMTDYQAWAGLFTLTVLESVLAIDNLIFLSLVWSELPKHLQPAARQIGLAIAAIGRVALLFSLTWLIGLTEPILSLAKLDFSSRDIVLIGGGLFLLAEGTVQIHSLLEGYEEGHGIVGPMTFFSIVVQMLLLDAVFALDSMIMAVGMVDSLSVIVAAVVISMVVMLVAANPIGNFVKAHPTVKALALSFLLLVGTALIADGLQFHIPRGYLYLAVALAATVEALNVMAARSRKKRRSGNDAPG